MRIYCPDPAIFEQGTVHGYRQLSRLFQRASQGQHDLHVSDVDALLNSDFFQQACPPMDRNAWKETIERTALSGLTENREQDPVGPPQETHAHLATVSVSIDVRRRWSLTLDNAGDWAERTVRVLLENLNDWILLEAAARSLGFNRVLFYKEKGWLVPDGRGGCGEVLNEVKRHCEPGACACAYSPAGTCSRQARLFVFVDSDHDASRSSPDTTPKDIRAECILRFVPCHLTDRHEIENYIPPEILRARTYGMRSGRHPKTNRRYPAILTEYLALSDAARDRDDLKKRFGDEWMARALQAVREVADENAFDPRARQELRQVLAELEEQL